ncbi:hypothetical protein Tsp_08300 [Trichinella spiralis]|uniref:hypothetical protein n=1 Tax=Trichinella spiralis TaxID=6334 RepID=UPI0001EFCF03|nr:hypothetical protein Tsp_08300 [Trichinella spiralis]
MSTETLFMIALQSVCASTYSTKQTVTLEIWLAIENVLNCVAISLQLFQIKFTENRTKLYSHANFYVVHFYC